MESSPPPTNPEVVHIKPRGIANGAAATAGINNRYEIAVVPHESAAAPFDVSPPILSDSTSEKALLLLKTSPVPLENT